MSPRCFCWVPRDPYCTVGAQSYHTYYSTVHKIENTGVAAAPGALDLRISNEKSQIGVATRLDAERDALRPSSLLGGMHLPSGYAAVKMRTS